MGKYKIVFSESGLIDEIRERIIMLEKRLVYYKNRILEEKIRCEILFEDL